jgi:putative transcriptional regulator
MGYNNACMMSILAREVCVMSFSEDLKRIRRKAFMTQEDFAKELGVSFATVNRWETGKAKPTLKTMKLIDDYCKKHTIDFDISEEINS